MQAEDVELGYFAHPSGGSHPGIVLLHDVWGLGDHARDLTWRLAEEGFAVLGLDLYRREADIAISNPGEWIRELSDPQILDDVQAGAEFLAQQAVVRGSGAGVVGFCMGGMYALMAGSRCPGIAACAPFYGLLSHDRGLLHTPAGLDPVKKPHAPLDCVEDLHCPLLGFFGDRDDFVPLSDIEVLRERLDATGPADGRHRLPGCRTRLHE